ncbi:hypothetical protein [Geomicrobium sp. JCM 19055]|uniref:hypothetical protein n=1 Tax=Geomicrobium sp. JCM 19055 TaxID=1460649 RepID=UPI00045ED9CF|nr:hypothetical protein [Geomicrobium sp. JCM 19055]GAJ99942.1 hypothetical protein JCM19055_3005 [Geomicrobium sp. JCM 19055]
MKKKKDFCQYVFVRGSLLVVFGSVIIFQSGRFGTFLGDYWLRFQAGGSAPSADYVFVTENFVRSIANVGVVLFTIGLLSLFATLIFQKYQADA